MSNVFDLIREQNAKDEIKAKEAREYKKRARKWLKEHPVEVAAVMEKHKNDPVIDKSWRLEKGELISNVKHSLRF